ncbi:MAG TPA: hypothetical protein VGE74_17025 [Gemmata sp.]
MSIRGRRADLRRRAAALLDQQLWCWGRDVARPEGNVLLGLGMCRYRATGARGGTAYTGRVAGDGVVWLWGFGLLYGLPDLGGVFLRRNGFEPLLLDRPPGRPVHRPEHVGPCARPVTARQRATAGTLVRAAADWIAGYEHWVAETFGAAYREATLAARDRAPAVPGPVMAKAWEHLAKKAPRLAPQTQPDGARGALLASLCPLIRSLPAPALPRERRDALRQQRYRTA